MKPTVYIKTTIPSFFFEIRPEAEMVARKKFEHIRIINTRLGLFVPSLVTPMELCMENET